MNYRSFGGGLILPKNPRKELMINMNDLILLLYAFFSDTLLGKSILVSYAVSAIIICIVTVFQIIMWIIECIKRR